MSEQIVLAARSSSSKSKTGKTSTYKTGTSTNKHYSNGKSHLGAGGSAIWFVIMAVVALFVVFLGVKFFRGKAAGR